MAPCNIVVINLLNSESNEQFNNICTFVKILHNKALIHSYISACYSGY